MTGAAHDRLLSFVESRTISDIVPYGLGPMLETASGRTVLAAWLDELHARGARVIAPIANTSRLASLDVLFLEHPSTFIDGVITEYEFWNAPERGPAFATMLALVGDMRSRTGTWNNPALRVGAYLGYPSSDEAARLASVLDFVFLDYSVSTPERAWSKTRDGTPLRVRYAAFASLERWPIFYATGEVDMKQALDTRGLPAAERVFVQDSGLDHASPPEGFAYFTYEALPD